MAFKGQKCLLRGEEGQIILIVVLVMVIALTIGLSVTSRGIIGVRTSTEEADSQRALTAAETGVERSSQSIQPVSFPIPVSVPDAGDATVTNSKYSVTVNQVPAISDQTSFLVNGGLEVSKDEGADVWFVGHIGGVLDYTVNSATNCPDIPQVIANCSSDPNKVNLYWGSSSDGCNDAAIQAIVVTRDYVSPFAVKTYRYVYDACSARKTGNNFTAAETNAGGYSIAGSTFTHRTPNNDLTKNINNPSTKNIVYMRVIPLYKNAKIAVYARDNNGTDTTNMPIQGYQITSIGTSGNASRTVSVFKGWSQTYLPYLSYGLFVAADSN